MKAMEIPNVIDAIRTVIGSGTGGLGNKKTCEDHPNYYIVEIGQNTEKSSGDLSRLVENHQLTLVYKKKTLKWIK